MDNNLVSVLSQGSKIGAGASASGNGTVGASTVNKPTPQNNALIEALTARLTQQGQGISSSSTTSLQDSINEALAATQVAGDLGRERLISERDREVAFARDRAGATYTGALEGRRGYATQVAGLRELTETTEKSIRDLDARYQEAILANDSATASRIADLKVKKLEFQQEQEQNFFSNLLSAANLQQSQIDSLMRNEQFWAGQEESQRQFAMQMAQSDYQFQQNLGIQYKELDLQAQELDIARERNEISWAEYGLRKDELNKSKQKTALSGMVYEEMLREVRTAGKSPDKLDPTGVATAIAKQYADMGLEVDFQEVLQYAQEAKVDMVTRKVAPFNEVPSSEWSKITPTLPPSNDSLGAALANPQGSGYEKFLFSRFN